MGLPIPILQYMFTLLIAIPSVCSLIFLLVQFSKSCVRASTQLSVHCWAWILYFASGFIHAAYVLIRWKGAGTFFVFIVDVCDAKYAMFTYSKNISKCSKKVRVSLFHKCQFKVHLFFTQQTKNTFQIMCIRNRSIK